MNIKRAFDIVWKAINSFVWVVGLMTILVCTSESWPEAMRQVEPLILMALVVVLLWYCCIQPFWRSYKNSNRSEPKI